MTRIKRGVTTGRRHKKILKLAKGYRAGRHKVYRQAKRAVMKAGLHAFAHRRAKKRDFRHLWITRINAALKSTQTKYSRFIYAITLKNIQLDRKMLALLAAEYPKTFEEIRKKIMA
jgi:large subunit ribosomal protein L20